MKKTLMILLNIILSKALFQVTSFFNVLGSYCKGTFVLNDEQVKK